MFAMKLRPPVFVEGGRGGITTSAGAEGICFKSTELKVKTDMTTMIKLVAAIVTIRKL